MEPEYQAAQMAYMRYHNMNPIFGISSKYVWRLESATCVIYPAWGQPNRPTHTFLSLLLCRKARATES